MVIQLCIICVVCWCGRFNMEKYRCC